MASSIVARGIRKSNELIVQKGRSYIFTEEDADKLNWSDIPAGALKINPKTGLMEVKIEGQSTWVPAGIKNEAVLKETYFFEKYDKHKFYNIGEAVIKEDTRKIYKRIQITEGSTVIMRTNVFTVPANDKIDIPISNIESKTINLYFKDEDPDSATYDTYVNAEAVTVLSQTDSGITVYNVTDNNIEIKIIMDDNSSTEYIWADEDWEEIGTDEFHNSGAYVTSKTEYKNDGTICIAKDTYIQEDNYKITAINDEDFYYTDKEGNRHIGIYDDDRHMVFETSKEYQPARNSLEVYIDDLLRRTASDGELTEIDTTRFSINENLEVGHELTVRYNAILRIGNPYPRIFINDNEPAIAEIGDILIDTDATLDDDILDDMIDSDYTIPWGKISGKPTTLLGYGIKDDVEYKGHVHNYMDILGTPTSMKANGGNSDTVDGYHADNNKPGTLAIIDPSTGILPSAIMPTMYVRGMIMMWYGSPSTVPAGWAICDGANGTPDLRNRFIVGAGSGYGLGATGGENTHVLSWNEMPSHAHTRGSMNITGNIKLWKHFEANGAFGINGSWGSANSKDGGHDSTAAVNFDASRSWTGETSYAGSSWGHENRPPYYALYYIMKL